MKSKVIAWFSGGITSAVACKWALESFQDVDVVFIDTRNEDDDTYRFLEDCEKWYGVSIKRITNDKYESIDQVWERFLSLNTAHGAICSSELKREMRVRYQNENPFWSQIFGFDSSEIGRHSNMRKNYPETNCISPLVDMMVSKEDAAQIIIKAGIDLPRPYRLGYRNNNCFKTGCVQGGIGYWQKIQKDDPIKFDEMAAREHKYTDLKGKPVTICKDQSKGGGLVFLKPHPDYPEMKDLSMMKGREPEPLLECNGFCYTK